MASPTLLFVRTGVSRPPRIANTQPPISIPLLGAVDTGDDASIPQPRLFPGLPADREPLRLFGGRGARRIGYFNRIVLLVDLRRKIVGRHDEDDCVLVLRHLPPAACREVERKAAWRLLLSLPAGPRCSTLVAMVCKAESIASLFLVASVSVPFCQSSILSGRKLAPS